MGMGTHTELYTLIAFYLGEPSRTAVCFVPHRRIWCAQSTVVTDELRSLRFDHSGIVRLQAGQ